MTTKPSPGRRIAALCVLFLLPLALRLVPLRHGMPRNYVPDTHMVRAALSMARDRDLTPPPGKYSIYPNLMPYLLLPCYAGEYAIGSVVEIRVPLARLGAGPGAVLQWSVQLEEAGEVAEVIPRAGELRTPTLAPDFEARNWSAT